MLRLPSFLQNLITKSAHDAFKKNTFHPSVLNDKVASTTGWNSIQNNPIKDNLHSLHNTSNSRYIFKLSFWGISLYVLLFTVVILGTGVLFYSHGDSVTLFALPIILYLFIISLHLRRNAYKIIFDKNYGYVWRVSFYRNSMENLIKKGRAVKISNVYALQIISKLVPVGKGVRDISYELNLVTSDTKRMSLVTKGNLKKILADAEKLSLFLEIPVWNGAVNKERYYEDLRNTKIF